MRWRAVAEAIGDCGLAPERACSRALREPGLRGAGEADEGERGSFRIGGQVDVERIGRSVIPAAVGAAEAPDLFCAGVDARSDVLPWPALRRAVRHVLSAQPMRTFRRATASR